MTRYQHWADGHVVELELQVNPEPPFLRQPPRARLAVAYDAPEPPPRSEEELKTVFAAIADADISWYLEATERGDFDNDDDGDFSHIYAPDP